MGSMGLSSDTEAMTHDPSYKLLFSKPRMVEDLLRGFVPLPWIAC